jgi:hypothetical protein
MMECNFNGPAFTSSTHGEYGTGLAAAVYINGAPFTLYKVVGAFAQVGIVIGDSVGTSPSFATNCRAEFNQGHGWVNLGANVCNFTSCSAYDNNRDTSTPTYSGFYGVSSTAFARNAFTDCIVTGIDGTYIQLYGFTDQNNGGGNPFKEANHYNAGCRAPGLIAFNPTFGACLPIIDRQNRLQSVTIANGAGAGTTTFDGEEGNMIQLVVNDNSAQVLDIANFLPGNMYDVSIFNGSGATPSITLAAKFRTVNYAAPANNKFRTARFYVSGANLIQVGDWSADL